MRSTTRHAKGDARHARARSPGTYLGAAAIDWFWIWLPPESQSATEGMAMRAVKQEKTVPPDLRLMELASVLILGMKLTVRAASMPDTIR